MNNLKSYFSEQVLEKVLKQYTWIEQYDLQNAPPNSVIIKFPKCSIIIVEGFESKMNAYFLNKEIGRNETQHSVSIFDAVGVIKTRHKLSEEDKTLLSGVVRFLDAEPSLKKVKQGLKNICILLHVYFLPCIKGDFSWVEEYNKQNPE